jgi:putative peptidoglycan lipid II flippase
MVPVLFGIGVYYVDVVIARRLLSELDVGAQSYFGWALRLCDFPQGIFVMALQSATLPSLALLVARGDLDEVAKTFAFGMRLALFVGIGATALFVALAEPLVVAIFQRGEFDALAARETARALAAQGLGIWTVAAVRQLVAVYYALGDTRTPVIVAAIDLAVFIAVALALRGPLGHVGISVAVATASAAQMILLWVVLARRLPGSRLGEIAASALRTLLAAGGAAGLGMLVARFALERAGEGGLGRMVPGIAGAVAFGIAFLALARLLRSEELATITSALARRRR